MEGNSVCNAESNNQDAESSNRQWQFMTVGKTDLTPIEAVEAQTDYALAYSAEAQTLRFLCESSDRKVVTFTANLHNAAGMLVGRISSSETFSTASLPRGLYIVSWKFGGTTHSCKFIK